MMDSGIDGLFGKFTDDSLVDLSVDSSSMLEMMLEAESPQSNMSFDEPITPLLQKHHRCVERAKISYTRQFGQYGVNPGQFSEPSGIAATINNDIAITDTNNHRVQIYNKEGQFLFQFGERGKRDGQLYYPHRITVSPVTGEFIITERSPSNQIQIFCADGRFVRKFGAAILQHPRSICVDYQNFVIVVECKVKRIVIFDAKGNVFSNFYCVGQLQFPNCVCANDRNQLFISDNREHCIKVFSYHGEFFRQIGCPGITNFPVGVAIDGFGNLVVCDNHNYFHVTVFDQEGNFIKAYESTAKHLPCFDSVIMHAGYVAIASKDYRVYIYQYEAMDNKAPNLFDINIPQTNLFSSFTT
ncbi:hypothetical protein M3Y98_00206900 [Aphelenchoides besseyi]|nr:hypothetical protein M3Y98_00206900 [Aphelenchoides besseyi]KAI6200352.1 hypothetical protein M3Y96_00724700 [Aphelenchoides besseyi]